MAMDLSINMDAGEIAEVRGQLIPDGKYLAKITEIKVNPSKSEANKGKPVLQVDFKIIEDGVAKGRRFRSWMPVWKGAHFRFAELLVATGQVPEGSTALSLKNPDDLLNQEVVIQLGNEKDSREGHEDEDKNYLMRIHSAGGGIPGAPTTAKKTKVGFSL